MPVVRNWRDQTPRIGHDCAIIWNLLTQKDKAQEQDLAAAHLRSKSRMVKHRVQGGMSGDYHSHENAEQLYYILRGESVFLLGTEMHPLSEGDIIYIPPRTPHRLFSDSSDWIEHLILSFEIPPGRTDFAAPLIRNWREQTLYAEGHADQILWPLLRHKDKPPIKWLTDERAYALTGDLFDISRNMLQPRGKSKEHAHQGVEQIYYILGGCGQIALAGGRQPIQEGDIVWLNEGDTHQLINDGEDWVEYLILTCDLPKSS